jgi:Mannosyltransferase (PIG-V)
MWTSIKHDLCDEWEIIKPVLCKSLILKLALIVLVWAIHTTDNLIYKPDLTKNSVYNPTNSVVGVGLIAMVEWDAIYFLHGILADYNNLKMFAFYPGFPTIIKALMAVLSNIPGISTLINMIPPTLYVLGLGVVFNLLCHLANNWLLYQWLRIRGFTKNQAYFAALTFGLGGNALFHIVLYSESTYMLTTLLPLYILAKAGNNPAGMGFIKFCIFSFCFSMSGFFRSVGLMNGAYLGYPLLLELFFTIIKKKNYKKAGTILLRIIIVIVNFLTPSLFLHLKTRRLFCHAPSASDPAYETPGFCEKPTGYFYSYIQEEYWNLRLFDYFKNPYHMDVWVFAFTSCTVVTIWLYKAYKNAGLSGLVTLHIPEYLSNKNLLSPRILELPDIIAFTIQYIGYYGYAHLGSIERFWSATPAYYIFAIVAQQALVKFGESKDNSKSSPLWKSTLAYIIPGSLVVRQFLVPIFYALRIIPI